jgi:hypothetical protein
MPAWRICGVALDRNASPEARPLEGLQSLRDLGPGLESQIGGHELLALVWGEIQVQQGGRKPERVVCGLPEIDILPGDGA